MNKQLQVQLTDTQKRYEELRNWHETLWKDAKTKITSMYNQNIEYISQLTGSTATKYLANEEKKIQTNLAKLADNIYQLCKRNFLNMVLKQKEKYAHDLQQMTTECEQNLEQRKTSLQNDIDSAGAHLEQEIAYI